MYKVAFLGIGTNKGERKKNISLALKLLSKCKKIKILKVSNLIKNPPQEGIKSGYFLNGAIKIYTTFTPVELLQICKRIEKRLGRKTRSQKSDIRKYKSRIIDLDILFYGDEVINTKDLTIPHPRLHKRYFVLIPLMEIGKRIKHPTFNKSIYKLYCELNKNHIKYA